MPRQVTEARRALPAEAAEIAGSSGRLRVQLIDAGWGSSGYYPAEMLQRDGATAFPAGTHMYFDHAGFMEANDRGGIRSVRDLAAVTTSAASYNPATRALEADVQVLAPFRELITELAPHVGLSITGSASGETGEADGRIGLVFTELTEGYSCDFVAFAGRGGRVLQVLEHAVRRAHEGYGLTASDQSSLLSTAVSDTYGGQGIWTWIRDYTDSWVVFECENTGASDVLLQVTYTVTDGVVAFTSDPVEVFIHTQYLPVGTTPPAQSVPTPTTEDSTMPEISEADLRDLREAASTVQAAEQARQAAEQRAEEAERRTQLLTAAGVARGRIDTALTAQEAADLPAAIRDRVRTQVITADLPLTESGELDIAAFDQRVTAVIATEREFVATLAEQLGAGRPRGVGGTGTVAGGDDAALTEAQAKLTEAFKGFGMNDDGAALAARGRS